MCMQRSSRKSKSKSWAGMKVVKFERSKPADLQMYKQPGDIMTNKLTYQEIVDMNKEYTFFSWSVQGQVSPIPVTRAEGVYFWDADDKRYLDFSSQLMNA